MLNRTHEKNMTLFHSKSNTTSAHKQPNFLFVAATTCILLGLSVSLVHAQAAKGDKLAPQPSTLPGGASSLTETFEDWTVSCAFASGQTQCIVSQSQVQQNGQRVLDIRLSPVTQQDGSNGSVTLPFGLELARGVSVQLDDGKAGKPLSFKTCLPNGCVAPLSVDQTLFNAMLKGASLKLISVSMQNETIPFAVSLKGLGPAMNRAKSLSAAE